MEENNKMILPTNINVVSAEYKQQIIEDYIGNPLIEALPPILTKEEVIENIAYYPNYYEKERKLEPHLRVHIIQRIFQYFQPLAHHIDLENRISRMIRQGYMGRNPIKPQYTKMLHRGNERIKEGNINYMNNVNYPSTAAGFTLVGPSGMGKSTAVNRILSTIPQVIVHSNYKGVDMNLVQINYLKIDCPHDGSIKSLCVNFFIKIDNLLGTNYYQKFGKSRLSVSTMLPAMAQIAASKNLGLLIIDEIQHLSSAKSQGSTRMMNFFVTMINMVNVPIMLIGTNSCMPVLQGSFREARRGSGQGDMVWERMKKDISWDLLIEGLWEYQWTRKECELTEEINEALYDESQGVMDIAVKLYFLAQIRAIATGKEEINARLIRQVAKDSLQLVRPMINALRLGKKSEIARYTDIAPINIEGFIQGELSKISLNTKIKEIQKLKKEEKKLQSNNIKDEAILKLLELDVSVSDAKKYVEKITTTQGVSIGTKEIVKLAFKMILNKDIDKDKKTEVNIKVDKKDLRVIIQRGKEKGLKAYEALKREEVIKIHENDIVKAV
ncbi:ATP-binding protein [Anaerophilus nitritogenes]|uniref:ATP-binding protein n=1 Tax=Anaerophilus nitritogenes TaxID=2498136 RepID=UPI0019310900|nr:ATP-binding protein [Anaerophilus nitritogenes]